MDDSEKPDILAVWEAVGYDPPANLRDGWTKVKCPTHMDSNPSASINPSMNRWKCFVCDINEDSLDILMRERGISLAEARRQAASEFGSSTEVRAVSTSRNRVARRSLWND